MTRLILRLVIGCFIAVVLWWVGPLLAIGVYKPLGWAPLRRVLVALVLLWALWPIVVRVFARISLSKRRIHPAAKAPAEKQDPLSRRLGDLDEYLRQRWLSRRPGWRAAWAARNAGAHRNLTPWFAIVGASGSGKTTLIRHGGIALKESADLLGRNGDEEGSTVDCNFWHAGDAIWFDINGRWVEPGGGDASGSLPAWSDFLNGLRKTKRHSALDGILLCVDSDWLLRASVEGRKRAADGIRARLADMARQLELRLPVWVALTGLDKVQGAVQFLSSLDETMLERGIGFALPATSGEVPVALAESLGAAMRKLEQGVQEHVLRTAPNSPDLGVSFERLVFVENLSKLHRHATDFLVRGMADATVEDHCQLRGIWMGSSVDLIEGQEPSLLELDAADIDAPAYGVRRLSMLWGAVLRQMIREKGLAAPLAARSLRRRLARAMSWALGISVLAFVIGVLTWGYFHERNHLERVWAGFTESKRLAEKPSVESRPAAALMDAMTQMRYIDYNLQNASELVVAPYREHARVAKVAGETYRRHLRKSLMPELYNYVTSTLMAQTQGAPGDTYETLKVYLMLSRPERRSADELVGWMATQWPKLITEGYSDEERQAYEGHLRSLFASNEIPGTPENAHLVHQARAKAAQVPSVARVIQRIKASGLPSRMEDVSLASAGGYMAATTLRMRSEIAPTDAAIPAWYTRAGYHDAFKPRLHQAAMAVLEEESWVLRDERLGGSVFEIERAAEKLADAARTQFLQEYIRRWQAFLNDVTVRRYSGMDDAAQLASSFIDPQSPLSQLIRFAARETSLTGNYAGDVDSWIERQKYNLERSRRAIVGELSGERERFKLLPEHVVDDHFESIRRLGVRLVETSSSGNGSSPLVRLFEPLYRQLSLVNGATLTGQILPEYDAFARLRAEAGRQPEPLRGIVHDLVNSGSNAGAVEARAFISRRAVGATRSFCNQGLSAKYPMRRRSQTEVGVQDFERLFGPQGSLAVHFKENLASYVDTSTSPWRARRVDGTQDLVNPDVLRAYESASRIGAATLDERGQLRITAIVRVIDMDPQIGEVQIDAPGTSIRYAHGSMASKRIDWTGRDGGQLFVRLSARTVDGRANVQQFDGPWALFRFYDSGRSEGADADRRETVHQTPIGAVRIEWQSLTTPAPLWSNLLQSFICPRS